MRKKLPLSQLVEELERFKRRCSVEGIDPTKEYIITRDENKAFKAVVKFIKDCI